MHIVYILWSEKIQKTYVGHTSNLEQRLLAYNELETKGWTLNGRPWLLLHAIEYPTKKEAMQKEAWLKTGVGRDWIYKQIDGWLSSGSYPPRRT